jgi:hypothetical protein
MGTNVLPSWARTRLYSCQVPISNILPILSNQHLQPSSCSLILTTVPPCQQLTNRLDVILGFGPCQSCQTGNLAGTWSPFLGSANYRSAPNVQYSRSALRCGNAKYTVEAVSFSNTTLRPYHTIIGTIQYGTGRYLQPPPGLFWPQAWKHQEPHRHLSIFVARGGIIFCSCRNSTSNSPHPRLQ